MSPSVAIRHIFISSGHNYFGRHGQTAGTHAARDVARVKCRSGWGLEGDRFYGYRPGYKGQVTFFSWETVEAARRKFRVPTLSPAAVRRNVIIEGIDLNTLIGRRFTLGGVEFEGTGEARPCHWMNAAVAPGAEDWLMGQGGLRTKVLTDGELAIGPANLWLSAETLELPLSAVDGSM
ncbi:MAG TPA: MOSC domain-containing protein [Opitutaceae bacterium]|nr:MOSC domain-containing protein [Opitutaceae bacterium]